VLGSAERQLPGVVCGAFAQFVSRLQHALLTGARSEAAAASLAAAYHVLEWLATRPEPDVIKAVVVEIVENLACEPPLLAAIKTHRGQAAGQLYDQWLG